jgi:hypothetical protein
MHVRNEMRLIVRRPGSGEPVHLVARNGLHAKLLTKIINACDLSDDAVSARRVLDLLLFTVSKECGAATSYEHNLHLQVKAFQSWLLFTLERYANIAAALCSLSPTEPQMSDLIPVRCKSQQCVGPRLRPARSACCLSLTPHAFIDTPSLIRWLIVFLSLQCTPRLTPHRF